MAEFDWDEANLAHVSKHGFSREDAESAILDPRRVPTFAKREVGGEIRYGIIGKGVGGDILHVVFSLRGKRVRPFHCREANRSEKSEV